MQLLFLKTISSYPQSRFFFQDFFDLLQKLIWGYDKHLWRNLLCK